MMQTLSDDSIQAKIASIRASVASGNENSVQLPATLDGRPVRLAITQDNLPELILPHRQELKKPATQDRDGVRIRIAERIINAAKSPCLVIECRDRDTESPFSALVADILRRLSAGASRNRAVEDALQAFTRLVEQPPKHEIGENELIGVIGELLLLRALSQVSPDAHLGWYGPESGTQDFLYSNTAIEIKTTRKKGNVAVTINRPEQLFAPEGRDLYLIVIQVEADPSGELQCLELYRDITSRIEDSSAFSGKLIKLGLDLSPASNQMQMRFRLVSMGIWNVTEAFPKIPKESIASLHPAISGIQYQLSIDHLDNWRRRETLDEFVEGIKF